MHIHIYYNVEELWRDSTLSRKCLCWGLSCLCWVLKVRAEEVPGLPSSDLMLLLGEDLCSMSLKHPSFKGPAKATWVSEISWVVSSLRFSYLFDVAPDINCHEGLAKVASLSHFSEEDRHWDWKYINFTNIKKFKKYNTSQHKHIYGPYGSRAIISR